MNLQTFSRMHPEAYRRMLGALCIFFAASGVASMITGAPKGLHLVFNELAMTPPTATAAGDGVLTRLPGTDGSADPAAVSVAQATAAVISADGGNRALGRSLNALRFGDSQWVALDKLWTRESNWNHTARNRSSGAYGIPQALPATKMASAGSDWSTNPATQIQWGLSYIAARYGTPSNAWAHELRYGWY